jgi:hypothetical protein
LGTASFAFTLPATLLLVGSAHLLSRLIMNLLERLLLLLLTPLLFLDEPFESIDPGGVALLKQWLERFVAGGRRAAIIRSPGQLLWEGDITAFADDRPLLVDRQEFRTLEAPFLHLAGERYADVGWLWGPRLESLPG